MFGQLNTGSEPVESRVTATRDGYQSKPWGESAKVSKKLQRKGARTPVRRPGSVELKGPAEGLVSR
jgi:hypothetical protein